MEEGSSQARPQAARCRPAGASEDHEARGGVSGLPVGGAPEPEPQGDLAVAATSGRGRRHSRQRYEGLCAVPGAPDHFARSYYDHAATLRERCGPFVGDEKRCDFDLEVSGTSYAVSLRIGWDVVLSLCPAGERFKCIVLAFVGAGVSAEEASGRVRAGTAYVTRPST